MIIRSVSRSRRAVWGMLAAFALFVVPAGEMTWAKSTGGTLVGFVYAQDMKTPFPGAVVKVRNIASQKEYASDPADANGMYKVGDIEEGRYIVGVTSAAGDFNFDYVVLLKAGETAKLSVGLVPGGKAESKDSNKKNFFATNAGFAVMAVAAVAIFYVLTHHHEAEASPIR